MAFVTAAAIGIVAIVAGLVAADLDLPDIRTLHDVIPGIGAGIARLDLSAARDHGR